MTAPRGPRRPFRSVGISPETAWVLTQVRQLLPDFDRVAGHLAQKHLDIEARLRFHDDLEDVQRQAVDWSRWRAFDRRFDVEPANPSGSNLPAGLPHDDEIPAPQVAAELGVSPQHVGRLVRCGELVGRKVNARCLMVTRASVEAFKARRAG